MINPLYKIIKRFYPLQDKLLQKLFCKSPKKLGIGEKMKELQPISAKVDKSKTIDEQQHINISMNKLNNQIQEKIIQANNNKLQADLLNEKSAQQLFLPPTFQKKNFISGLLTLTPKQNALLIEESPLGAEFRKILCTFYIKVCFNFSKGNTIEECITEGFKNVFGYSKALKMSLELKEVLDGKEGTFIQHFGTIYWCDRDFTYKLLKKLCDKEGIFCDTFENSPVNFITMVELFHAKRLQDYTQLHGKTPVQCHLIEPEGLAKLKFFFNPIISKEQTGQKHSDLLIVKNFEKPAQDVVKFYIDIKSYVTLSVYVSRFSLFPVNEANEKVIFKYMNNLLTSFQKYIKENNLNQEHNISISYKKLLTIKKTTSNILVAYKETMAYLAKIKYEQDYENLNISLALDAGIDLNFDLIIQKGSKDLVDFSSKEVITLMEKLFVKTPILEESNKQAAVELLNILKRMLPEELQENLLVNHTRFALNTIA